MDSTEQPAPAGDVPSTGSAPGEDALTRRQVYLLVLVLLVLSNVPLAFLIWLWPEDGDLDGPHDLALGGGHTVTISPEHQVLLCIAFCGLLGGSIQMLLRFRADSESFVSLDRLPWYFLTPPIGAILAVGFYFVVRGGFFASSTSVGDVNVFAFGGTAVLVGIFAEAATRSMERAFTGAFSSDKADSSQT